jgi:gliding motility-associated-like protein
VKLTITSVHGCLNDTTILVSYLPVPAFNYGPQFFGYCEDETVVFYDSSVIVPPTTIVSWEWTFGCGHKAFIQNPSHFFDSAGSYTIKLKTTSSDGCVFYDSLLAPLIIYPKPIADFLTAPSIVSVFRPEVYFDNKTTGAVSYVWDFGDGTTATDDFPTHMFPNIVGYYTTVQYAYSAFGCVDSTSQTIYVKDEFTLYAPNAFTPDKGFNKLFIVKGYEINDFHLKIFNRSGELIFETSDETEGWNGKHNGKNCPIGVYIFVIQAKDNIGNNHSKKGHVTLIR